MMDTLLTVTLKGSILQSSKGKYGHVAYIETINEDGSMQVSEMNYTHLMKSQKHNSYL